MPRLLQRQQPSGHDPEPTLVDGLTVNGRDAMAEKRAHHRARQRTFQAAERTRIPWNVPVEDEPTPDYASGDDDSADTGETLRGRHAGRPRRP